MMSVSKDLLHPDLHWVIEASSPGDEQSLFRYVDLPLTSNVLTFTESSDGLITLKEVYRPAPCLELR